MASDSEDTSFFADAINHAPGHTPASAEPAPTQPAVEPYQHVPVSQVAEIAPAPVAPAPVAEPEQQHRVPLGELLETRKRAQAAEAQALQLTELLARMTQPQQPVQQQPEPIDPDVDPAAYIRQMEQRLENRFLNQRLDMSEHNQRNKPGGAEIVDRALAAVEQRGPAFKQAFINQADPYAALVEWYQGEQMRQTIGDPAKYEADLTARIRAQIIAEMRTGSPPPANLPPSLSGATRASDVVSGSVESDRDFFNNMMNRKSR